MSKIKEGDIVTLLVGGPKMVVGSVQKGKNGVTDYADCYWVHKATGEHVNFETIDGKMIPVGALKLVES